MTRTRLNRAKWNPFSVVWQWLKRRAIRKESDLSDEGLIPLPPTLHLIQPVGFSLPNVVCALAHEGIQTATLLLTDEIPEEQAHRAIELANTCRTIALDPLPQIVKIPSPSADASVQFDALQSLSISENHEVVVGLTGGPQRVTCTLLSRYGSDRALWVVNEPRAFLSVFGSEEDEGQALEMEISDYKFLYGLDDVQTDDYEINSAGRLSFNRQITLEKIPGGGGNKQWRHTFREKIQDEVKLLDSLEEKFGRINFRFSVNIETSKVKDAKSSNFVKVIGRLPTRLNLTINGDQFVDRIDSVAMDDTLYSGFLRPDIYQLPAVRAIPASELTSTPPRILHLIVGIHNSVTIANSISNHKPTIVYLWAINHENNQEEIEKLCVQAFTTHGWLYGKLPEYFQKQQISAPVCNYGGPHRIFLINSNVRDLSKHAEFLSEEFNTQDSTTFMETSSGTGHFSHSLYSALLQNFPNVEMVYTQPWTGEISNLKSGENTTGKGIPIIDRLWLQQRPVKRKYRKIKVQDGQRNLLQAIAERSIDLGDHTGLIGRGRHALPTESWDGVSVIIKKPNSPKKPSRIFYSGFESSLGLSGELFQGFWLEEITAVIIAHDESILDSAFSVEILTTLSTPNPDIEIDGILMKEDGIQFISCKLGDTAWSQKTLDEANNWRALLGGPNPKPAMIVHSNTMMSFDAIQLDEKDVCYQHWFELIGLNYPKFSPPPIDLDSPESLLTFLFYYVEMHTSESDYGTISEAKYDEDKNQISYFLETSDSNQRKFGTYMDRCKPDLENWISHELQDPEIKIKFVRNNASKLEDNTIHRGKVKNFITSPGTFGFIAREGEDDIFFHKNDVEGIIEVGDSVTFHIGSNEQGQCAISVRKISEEEE